MDGLFMDVKPNIIFDYIVTQTFTWKMCIHRTMIIFDWPQKDRKEEKEVAKPLFYSILYSVESSIVRIY